MLDRLISGAGALTDRADRLVRLFTSGRGPDVLANRPGSVIVILLLIGAAIFFGLLAIEATDNPSPRTLAPAEVAAADDLGNRIFATVEGVLDENYVETYPDDDNDGVQDTDESGDAWYYFLVDDSGRGVTVRSTRHPDALYQYTATGVVVRDPAYVGFDVAQFHELDGTSQFDLDGTFYLDATANPGGEPRLLDLGGEMPAAGTLVSITGPYFGYLDVCSGDADGDGECEEAEFDLLDAFIGDPDSGRAITVVKEDHPAPVPIAFTGMLRSDPRSIVDAKATQGLQFDQLGITVSDRYLLVDQASPANGALSLAVAVAAGLLAAVLTIGLVGGYLVYRRSKAALPSGGRKLAAGQAIPLRVTGSLRRADGLIHVREASAQLVRFPLDVVQAALPEAAEPTPVDAAGSAEPTDVPATLIVERQGKPEGVALGRGELKQVTAGRVMRFRGARPALRVVAGTGALLLSFETIEERDRAAGELIGESGLLIQGSVAGGVG